MEHHAILADDKRQYQKEQDQILKTLIDYRFFNPWRHIESEVDDRALWNDSNLEIYITNQCNQNCEYCYLTKHSELYPLDKRDPELLLKNLRILYDYIMVNNFHIPTLDFFSGEIWHTKLGVDILRTTLDYIKKGMKINQILIASNCSFVQDDESFHTIQSLINESLSMGTPIGFSISIDGKIMDEKMRPRNSSKPYTDEFYNKLFAFAKMNEFCFHPMVSSSNVKYWKENYAWWEQMFEYYNIDLFRNLMMLEVRNNDWTDESIQDYCEFLKFLIEKFYEKGCNKDFELFANTLAAVRDTDRTPNMSGYYPWLLNDNDTFLGCSVTTNLTVRLGDLALCPCHRQAYDKYLFGYFNVENDKITGIHATNPYMAMRIFMSNLHTTSPRCAQCIYNRCCLHGCMGSQIEANNDPLFPIDGVCKMFKRKYAYLIQVYRDMGLIDYYKKIDPEEYNTSLVKHILNLERMEQEVRKNGMGES